MPEYSKKICEVLGITDALEQKKFLESLLKLTDAGYTLLTPEETRKFENGK